LTIIAVVMFPLILPQMAQLVTGLDPASPEFRAARAAHLRLLGDLLQRAKEVAH
jgi:hypothetical protein